ncbi:MAG: glycosyltransferase, partial [Lutibacter sp.]
IISILYIGLMFLFMYGLFKFNDILQQEALPKTTFSIVVPFRNEEENLESLLQSFIRLNYPRNAYEIILVNDHSTDNFRKILQKYKTSFEQFKQIDLLKKDEFGKKAALKLGIKQSQFNYIVTTDADCVAPENWLKKFNDFIVKTQPDFIAGPVFMNPPKTFLEHFQYQNFISLVGCSIGSFMINKPIMCNGANLCFSKKTYLEFLESDKNQHIASGDDIFFMEYMVAQHSKKIHYLPFSKSVISTKFESNYHSFLNQQIRWASKSSFYKNSFLKATGIIVFAENLIVVVLFLYALLNQNYFQLFLFFAILKLLIDGVVLTKTTQIFQKKISYTNYIINSFIYPFFTVKIAVLSLFKKYSWKSRFYKY